jgi:hypothetical protein
MQPCRIHGRRRDLSPRWWSYVVMVLSASMYQDRSCRTLYGTVIGYCDVNVEMAVSLTSRSIYVVISTFVCPITNYNKPEPLVIRNKLESHEDQSMATPHFSMPSADQHENHDVPCLILCLSIPYSRITFLPEVVEDWVFDRLAHTTPAYHRYGKELPTSRLQRGPSI